IDPLRVAVTAICHAASPLPKFTSGITMPVGLTEYDTTLQFLGIEGQGGNDALVFDIYSELHPIHHAMHTTLNGTVAKVHVTRHGVGWKPGDIGKEAARLDNHNEGQEPTERRPNSLSPTHCSHPAHSVVERSARR